jgi:DNA-binding NarL/FixJ family response regulator
MDHIRVLVTAMPSLHADIIRRIIREQPDMEIVGEAATIESIGAVIEHTQPDVVLVTTGSTAFVGAAVPLVLDHPHVRVVAVDTERNGWFVEARLSEWLTKAWPDNLVDTIRHAMARRVVTPPSGREPG